MKAETQELASGISIKIIERYFPKGMSKKDIDTKLKNKKSMIKYLTSLSLTSTKFTKAVETLVGNIKTTLPSLNVGGLVSDIHSLLSSKIIEIANKIDTAVRSFERKSLFSGLDQQMSSGESGGVMPLVGSVAMGGAAVLPLMGTPASAADPTQTITTNLSGDGYSLLKQEISSGEGDYGAYNRGVAGDTPRRSRSVDIQSLSVGQIMQLQSERQLFAVGKYQFIPRTLREAVRYTGVSESAPFNSDTQEKLFEYLISDAKRPHLAAFIKGQSNDVDSAVDDLAFEFASMPGSDGRGKYDGLAGNRGSGGSARVEKIKQILYYIRNQQSSNQQTTVQKFSKGKLVKQPTLALIGEGKEAEYVIPESKLPDIASLVSPKQDQIFYRHTRYQPIIIKV